MSDSRINALLERWENHRLTGIDISVEELCEAAPELIPALRAQIKYILMAERYLDLEGPDDQDMLPQLDLQHYAKLQPIGIGATAQVYSAEDIRSGELVAVKVISHDRRQPPTAIINEFRHLSTVAHKNLATLYEIQAVEDKLILIMELVVGGQPLHEYLNSSLTPSDQPLTNHQDLVHIRRVFAQIAHGLNHLHAHGILHLDIKPSNVLVDAQGIVKILDFGLAATINQSDGRDAAIFRGGTVPYLAPEQIAHAALSPACDWWGVGKMLLESLTHWRDIRWLEPRVHERHTDPGNDILATTVSSELFRLAEDLLNIDPTARPQGLDVTRRLESAEAPAHDIVPLNRTDIPLYGREPELAALTHALTQVSQSGTRIVVTEGPAGIGKTALIREFLRRSAVESRRVFHIKCYEREFVQGKIFDEAVQALVLHAITHHLEDTLTTLNQIGTRWLHAFPFLFHHASLAAFVSHPGVPVEVTSLRGEAERALQAIAARITRDHSAIFWIDDIQWLGTEELNQLLKLLCTPNSHFLVILGRRPEAHPTALKPGPALHIHLSPGSHPTAPVSSIALTPLPQNDCLAVAQHCLPRASVTTLRRIAAQSQGHPLFIVELCQFMAEGSNALPLDAAGPNATLESMILETWSRLDPLSQTALSAVALAAAPVPESVILRASSVPVLQRRHIRWLQVAGLTRSLPGPNGTVLVDTYHDMYRTAIVQRIEPDRKQQIHEALARQLHREGYDDLGLIAFHYRQAGCFVDAFHAYVEAGDKEAQRFSFDAASDLYDQAMQVAATIDLDPVPAIRRLATSLFEAGHPNENAPRCLALAKQAPRELSLDLQAKAVALLIRAGKFTRANEVANTLFRELQIDIPKQAWRRHLGMLWHIVALSRTPPRLVDAIKSEVDEDTRVRMWAYAFIGAYFCMTDGSVGPWMVTKGLRLSLKNGDPTSLLLGGSSHLVILSYAGRQFRRRCQQLIPELNSLASKLNDPILWSGVHMVTGLHHMTCGKWLASLNSWSHATELLRGATGKVQANIGQLRFFSTWSMFMTGQIKLMAQLIPDWLQQADDLGDIYIACMLRGYYANAIWLAVDQIERAQQEIAIARADWIDPQVVMQHVYWMLAEANILLYQGNGLGARDAIRAGAPMMKRSGAARVQFLLAEYHQYRARAALGAYRQRHDESLLREAMNSARHLRRMRSHWCDAWAAAIELLVTIDRTKPFRACELYHQAHNLFTQADMPLHAASLSLVVGTRVRPIDERDDLQARSVLIAQGIQSPETFARMLFPS